MKDASAWFGRAPEWYFPLMSRYASIALIFAIGCRTPTQVTIEVKTDQPCSAITGTSIAVGSLADLETAPNRATKASCIDGKVGTLVVVPSAGKGDEIAIRVVTGVGVDPNTCKTPSYGGCIVARRALHFIPHTELKVQVTMRGTCLDRPCKPRETCVSGNCVPAEIDSERCRGSGCDENALLPDGDAGVPDTNDAVADVEGGTDGGVSPWGDTRGLLAGSPWPMLNGAPPHWGVTPLAAPPTAKQIWRITGAGATTADIVGPDGVMYYGDSTGCVAIDPVTHLEKWRFPIGSGGAYGDPALGSDGILYIGGAGLLIALDRSTGKKIWDLAPAAVGDITLGPGPIAYMPGGAGVAAIDTIARKQLWFQPVGGILAGPSLAPTGKLYVATAAGEVHEYDMATGTPGWTFTGDGGFAAPPIVGNDGAIYAVGAAPGRTMFAIDAVTGKQKWATPLAGSTNGVAFAFARSAAGILYAGSSEGTLYAFDSSTGTELWSRPAAASTFWGPFVVDRNEIILAPISTGLAAYDGKNKGADLWRYSSGDGIAVAPGKDGLLYLTTTTTIDAIGP